MSPRVTNVHGQEDEVGSADLGGWSVAVLDDSAEDLEHLPCREQHLVPPAPRTVGPPLGDHVRRPVPGVTRGRPAGEFRVVAGNSGGGTRLFHPDPSPQLPVDVVPVLDDALRHHARRLLPAAGHDAGLLGELGAAADQFGRLVGVSRGQAAEAGGADRATTGATGQISGDGQRRPGAGVQRTLGHALDQVADAGDLRGDLERRLDVGRGRLGELVDRGDRLGDVLHDRARGLDGLVVDHRRCLDLVVDHVADGGDHRGRQGRRGGDDPPQRGEGRLERRGHGPDRVVLRGVGDGLAGRLGDPLLRLVDGGARLCRLLACPVTGRGGLVGDPGPRLADLVADPVQRLLALVVDPVGAGRDRLPAHLMADQAWLPAQLEAGPDVASDRPDAGPGRLGAGGDDAARPCPAPSCTNRRTATARPGR